MTDPLLDRLGDNAAVARPYSLTSIHPGAEEAYRPLRSLTRLGKLRLLDVACPNNHRLLQVVQTAGGRLIVGRCRSVRGYSVGGPASLRPGGNTRERRHRNGEVLYFLDQLYKGWAEGHVTVQCYCRERDVPTRWLIEQIDARKRRVVWPE